MKYMPPTIFTKNYNEIKTFIINIERLLLSQLMAMEVKIYFLLITLLINN